MVAGLAGDSTSFAHGFFHDACLNLEVVLGDGSCGSRTPNPPNFQLEISRSEISNPKYHTQTSIPNSSNFIHIQNPDPETRNIEPKISGLGFRVRGFASRTASSTTRASTWKSFSATARANPEPQNDGIERGHAVFDRVLAPAHTQLSLRESCVRSWPTREDRATLHRAR